MVRAIHVKYIWDMGQICLVLYIMWFIAMAQLPNVCIKGRGHSFQEIFNEAAKLNLRIKFKRLRKFLL